MSSYPIFTTEALFQEKPNPTQGIDNILGDMLSTFPEYQEEVKTVFDPFEYVPYMPQPGKGSEFFHCKADIIIFGGSAGSAKSASLLLKALQGASTPGYVATIFRRTSKDVSSEGGLWNKSKETYSEIPGARFRDSTQFLDWRFSPKSSISFAHSDNLFSAKLGAELCFIGIDEIAKDWTEKEFLFLLSRNRSSCGYKPQFVGTCNPDSESFLIKNPKSGIWKDGSWLDWWIDDDGFPISERSGIIRYFARLNEVLVWADSKEDLLRGHPEIEEQIQTGAIAAEELVKSFTFISATIYDNPAFLAKNPSYLANLLMMDELEKQRFLYGNWKVTDLVGIVFNPNHFIYLDEKDVPPGVDCTFWDFAATEELDTLIKNKRKGASENACYTASAKVRFVKTSYDAQSKKDIFDVYILRIFWEQTIDATSSIELAKEDGRECHVIWELEPGSASIKYASLLTKDLRQAVRGVQAEAIRPQGSKIARAKPWAQLARNGRIYVVRNAFWNPTFKNALIRFDGTSTPLVTDIIDSVSGALQWYLEHYKKASRAMGGTSKIDRSFIK